MEYEIHLTMDKAPTLQRLVDFANRAENLYAKPMMLLLSEGYFPLQLMATLKLRDENESGVISRVEAIADMLENGNDGYEYKVGRIKIESALCAGTTKYFEGHWKFTGNTGASWIDKMCLEHDFKFSRSVLRDPPVFWLTKRYHIPDHRVVAGYFANDLNLVVPHMVQGYHFERVVEDTNEGMDGGWF